MSRPCPAHNPGEKGGGGREEVSKTIRTAVRVGFQPLSESGRAWLSSAVGNLIQQIHLALIAPVSSTSTTNPSRLEGIFFRSSGVFFTTKILIHGFPSHAPIPVPTTPGIDIHSSVCCLSTASMVGAAISSWPP